MMNDVEGGGDPAQLAHFLLCHMCRWVDGSAEIFAGNSCYFRVKLSLRGQKKGVATCDCRV